jgi:hypothetical protein
VALNGGGDNVSLQRPRHSEHILVAIQLRLETYLNDFSPKTRRRVKSISMVALLFFLRDMFTVDRNQDVLQGSFD